MIWTARFHYAGPDRLDITRRSEDPVGKLFAPPSALLAAFLQVRDRGNRVPDAVWKRYAAGYAEHLARVSMDAKALLIGRQAVTLVCFCKSRQQCHRHLLAAHLEALGGKLGGEHSPDIGGTHVFW